MQPPARTARIRLFLSCLLWAAGLAAIAGCSGEPVGQVKGSVKFKGQSAGRTEVVFRSAAKPDDQYFGMSDESGAYQVSYRTKQGLPLGTYDIIIRRFTLPDGKPLPEGEAGEVIKAADGAVKDSRQFSAAIVSGLNEINFELTEGKQIDN